VSEHRRDGDRPRRIPRRRHRLSLLFGLPLLAGMVVTAVIVYGVLMLDRYGFRPIELIIASLVAIIGLCYLAEMFRGAGRLVGCGLSCGVPHIADAGALLLVVGIVARPSCRMTVYLAFGPDAGPHSGPQ